MTPLLVACLTLLHGLPGSAAQARAATFNVRDHGATGDGATLDTVAIHHAIDAADKAGGGQVFFPAGRYLTGTIHLKSRLTLYLEAGARIVGTTNLALYQAPAPPTFLTNAHWGKWHRGLIVGENLEDVTLQGPGTIDGNRVFDPTGEERMRGPHTFVFSNCRRFTLRDLAFVDSANYAVLFHVSDNVTLQNLSFTGGWDGIHFRGAPGHPCRRVRILDCQFETGDDSIAGGYWDDVVISGCQINSSCNGIRLISPATRLTIHDSLFRGPGTQPHRTSGRTNMLAGIILQPGAWEPTQGMLDDVLLSDLTMHQVASPVTIWTQPGNTAGRITIDRLSATGVYRSAISVESWSDAPVGHVVLRNIAAEFDGGGSAELAGKPVLKPGVDPRPLPAWGLYFRNTDRVSIQDVRLVCSEDDLRPALQTDGVRSLELDRLRFTPVRGADVALATNGVQSITVRD